MLDFMLQLRCDQEEFVEFRLWCESGKIEYTDLLREFIRLAPKGEVKFRKSENQIRLEKTLYDN